MQAPSLLRTPPTPNPSDPERLRPRTPLTPSPAMLSGMHMGPRIPPPPRTFPVRVGAHAGLGKASAHSHGLGHRAWKNLLLHAFLLGVCRSPSGMLRSRRGRGGGPLKARLPANPTFPTATPLQTLFPHLPHPSPALTMPHLCPVSTHPCPGGADVADPPLWGRLCCFPRVWGSQWHLFCLSTAQGVPVCPPPPLSRGVRAPEQRICAAPGVGTAGTGMRISAAHPVRWEWGGGGDITPVRRGWDVGIGVPGGVCTPSPPARPALARLGTA